MKSLGNLSALLCLVLTMGSPLNAGPLVRVANNTLQMPPAPPVFGYTITNAFGNLAFPNPVGLTSPPGETNRLFVIEQGGTISVITNLAAANRSVFLNISGKISGGVPSDERGLLGLAFHPGYATNGYFFVFYTGPNTTPTPGGTNTLHDILARYQVSATNANVADAASEVIFLRQYDQADNHNAGDIHFGPDGYLYAALGDEGGGNDSFNNSQTITKDFFSAILRLDVDKRPGNLAPNPHPSVTTNYLVPADNPFVGATSFNGAPVNPANVRTEFWAVGLRNPWRFTFDPATGDLYCADVGQAVYEEIDIIRKGGNYGWAYREGAHPGPKSPPGGFSSINPVQEYTHGSGPTNGNVVTGGVVYRGTRMAQLTGAYVFSDYGSGNIWQLRYNGTNATGFSRIAGESSISAFGIDPGNGDVLLANQSTDRIRRLVYSGTFTGSALPASLLATGAFADPSNLEPAPGVVGYDLNVPFWSDNAIKTRWFSVPNTNLTIQFSPDGNWTFPTGTVWVKHFDLPLTNREPASAKRIETRLLVKNEAGVYGVTYRWGDSLTNASLVAEEGLDEAFIIDDGGGILRTQWWHYPSRSECLSCHTPEGGFAAGFNTAQLNRDRDYGSAVTNQIAALSDAGYFDSSVSNRYLLPALAHPANAAVSLEYRARSYLAANCVQCHQPGGRALGLWDARIATPTAAAGLVDGPLISDSGDTNNRVLAPGSLANSMILTRISTRGPGRMPPLSSAIVDPTGIDLLSAWVTNDLPAYQTFTDWQQTLFGSTNTADALAQADPDSDLSVNYAEYLAGTDPLNPQSAWAAGIRHDPMGIFVVYPQIANRGFEVQATSDLFDPDGWLPLNAQGNEPFFASTNRVLELPDPEARPDSRFYRVRIFPP